ncbi:MFS transporter [Paractinoplanes abujensis]|uniref:MFS family permease n=1 Tax=Paractinoplanes abujensis TaxID=882441 RepID=A0A7W7CVP4_9ACTN|nr:MFS transporter [Actinoplanes abujensis]MBB4695537.1 MFS family permease [Actinoplanes abujensis]GID23120.1 MFS transporter [Actinoplanes abujensis]
MVTSELRTLLRDRRFVAYWAGQVTSVVGNALTLVVLPALLLPRGTEVFAVVLAIEAAAMGGLLLLGGTIADRCSRTLVMAVADVLRLVGITGFLLFGPDGPLPLLWLAAVLTGAGAALYEPAHRAALAQLVAEPNRQTALSLESATKRIGSLVGALLAGVLLAAGPAQRALAVDLATFAVSLATLLWLRLPAVRVLAAGTGSAWRDLVGETRAGIREVVRRPWVAVLMLQGTVQVFFLFAPNAILVPLVSQERYGPGAYAYVSAATLVGSVLGALAGGRLRPARPGWWAMHALALCTLTPLFLAVEVPLWALCLAGLAGSAGVAVFFILWYAALQREFPDEIQGRVFSVESTASFALQPIALALVPFVVGQAGLAPVAGIAAVVLLLSTYAVLAVPGVARLASSGAHAPVPVPAGR